MANQIEDLRNVLFAQLEKLSNPTCDLEKEIKRTNAMVGVGNVLVSSAKAEIDFMKVTGTKKGSGFIPESKQITK